MNTMRIFLAIAVTLAALTGWGANPTATSYTPTECQGSLRPYPTPSDYYVVPDSLTPVYISHVGRHGSRYPASATHSVTLSRLLHRADSAKTITPLGRRLMQITDYVIDASHNRWGALDSLGEAEQRGIASRMLRAFPKVLDGGKVYAISSYSPRCMMSMFSFTHQLDRLNNTTEFTTSTGRQNSELMRPFDTDKDYREFISTGDWRVPYYDFMKQTVPVTALERAVGKSFPWTEDDDRQELALVEYYVLAGLQCMSVDVNLLDFFNSQELNALWATFNLRQYLQRVATTLSAVPAEIASPLLLDIIDRADAFLAGKNQGQNVDLRFGHAETLMPLLSLMRLPGCYYLTNYFDTVALHWHDFDVVPMAANLQIVLMKTKKGTVYARFALNEKAVTLIPNDTREIIPWEEARAYLMRCIPLYYQP
ncbi:MAG: hypothetical protein LIO91_03300 [Bacteroidales bacterium]|nr:hypothetical protein [Bacteroidales bacterium]